MLDKKIVTLLNNQINQEFFSSYFYLSFANYYSDLNLDGFANWFTIQTQEERDHALLFIKFLQDNSEKVELSEIAGPGNVFESPKDPLIKALEHEQYVTSLINAIYEEAYNSKNFRTMQFLDWFIKEQMEEEKNIDTLIKKYELFGNDPKGLYLLNDELKQRVYVAPTLVV